MTLARLGQICLDCEDPAGLAAFWAALLGDEVASVNDDVVVVGNKGTPIAALRVPGYQPPAWPNGEIPKQIHLDLVVGVGELDAAEAEAIQPAVTALRILSRNGWRSGAAFSQWKLPPQLRLLIELNY